MREQLGYIHEEILEENKDICSDTDQSICHFEVRSINQMMQLVYTGQGCVCLRTACPTITIDNLILNETQFNLRICNFMKNLRMRFFLSGTCNITSVYKGKPVYCPRSLACTYRNESDPSGSAAKTSRAETNFRGSQRRRKEDIDHGAS